MYCLDVAFSFIFDVDGDIIQIHNDKNIKFFCEDLINVALEYCRNIDQSKRHHLILEIAVSSPKNSLPLISFTNSHLVIDTGKVELGKLPYLSQLI